MTDFNQLADRIVKQGIGCKSEDGRYDKTNWRAHGATEATVTRCTNMNAEMFCHDPRVAMALMEKVDGMGLSKPDNIVQAFMEDDRTSGPIEINDSLPLAITIACLEALEDD